MGLSLTELLERFQDISLCQLADALGPSCALETHIRPLDPEFHICGPATTVFCPPNDNLTVHHALHLAQPGQVLVVAGGGSCGAALWGELTSISAKSKGLRGTVIDGAARDWMVIREIGYPVFSRTITPRNAGKEKYGKLNTPIHCGSLEVYPGDIIFADANGILAISEAHLEEALRLALQVARKEAEIKEQIRSGHTIFDILLLETRLPQRRHRDKEL